MYLSHTSMELYVRCPQAWKLKYRDRHKELPKPYFNKGSAVHAALEAFYKGRLSTPPPLEDVLAAFEDEFDPEAYATDEERLEARADAQKMIREFYARYAEDFAPALMVEQDFFFELDGIQLRAKVDRIDKVDDEHVRIVDYKTGRFTPLEKVESNPQLALYQLAVEDQLGMEVDSLELYHVPSQTPVRVDRRNEEQIRNVLHRVVKVSRGIEDEAFEPAPGSKCKWCDFKPWCCLYADEYPENHAGESALLAPTREEAAELADRFGELKEALKPLKAELKDVQARLESYFAETGDRAAAGETYRVTAKHTAGWKFEDEDELRSILEPAGLWEKVLSPAWHLKATLLDDPEIPTELRSRLQEIAKPKEGWRLNYRKREE